MFGATLASKFDAFSQCIFSNHTQAQQQILNLQNQLDEYASEKQQLLAELQEREEELMCAEGKVNVLRKEVRRLMCLEDGQDGQ